QRRYGPISRSAISKRRSTISAAASAGTVRPLVRSEPSSLQRRILSAMALAPFPIIAIWLGSPWLPLLTALAAAVMAWEWGRLCRRGRFGRTGVVLVGVVLASVAAAALASAGLALGIAIFGAGVVFWAAHNRRDLEPQLTAFGALWVALPCV